MTRVLVIAEHDEAALALVTVKTVGAAVALAADRIDIAVLAQNAGPVAAQAAAIRHVDRVLTIERAANWPCTAAAWAPQLAELATEYTHVLAPATTFGKDLMPRLAALLGVGMLSDIIGIDEPYRFRRPVYAGNAVSTIAADNDCILCATVRPTAFPAPESDGSAVIESPTVGAELPAHTRFAGHSGGTQAGPDLQTAARVVGGGRGLGSREAVALVAQLAATLDAAVGASRAAVDAGWVANDLQIGQTGKVIAPSLYIAIGISGAIQHLTGIKDAGTIVAINIDAEAPICALADLVLQQDLFAAVPELIAGLEARRGQRG
jgi:electron transfer flavoprotein alpha subunit